MFAIVDIAGFQEKVAVGDKLKVPLLDSETDKKIVFESVLMLADGDKLTFGAPLIKGASVEAKVVVHGRYEKIRVVKMMKRKRYRRLKGHRTAYTSIEITGINV